MRQTELFKLKIQEKLQERQVVSVMCHGKENLKHTQYSFVTLHSLFMKSYVY